MIMRFDMRLAYPRCWNARGQLSLGRLTEFGALEVSAVGAFAISFVGALADQH